MKRTIVIIKWIGMAVIISWTVLLIAAFMSGFLFGTDDNLKNPEPESTHKIVEPAPTPIPTTSQQFSKSESNTVPIPDDYYSQDCELPTDQSMQEYLSNSHWVEDYEENSWDCSQMAAYMEFMLENCGYNVVIREADVAGEQYGHAWILVEFKEGWLAYECTERYWVYPNEAVARSYDPYGHVYWNPSMYDAGVQYDTIYDVWEYCRWYSNGEEAFLQEYGWWIE